MSELNIKRKNYQLQLRERRKLAHQHGRQIHALQSRVYPHPDTLLSRVGMRSAPGARGGTPSMWTVRPEPTPQGDHDDDVPEAARPWLTARIGVGITRVLPAVKGMDENRQPIDEQLEPFTAAAYRRFLRTQKFVTNSPLGLSLREMPAYGFRGDPAAVLGLARAVIVSLIYNSSPKDLAIGLICDNPNRQEWDWLKWVPHAQSRARSDRSGTARLAWRSVSEFTTEYVWGGASHTVVFIDTPDSEVALPAGFSADDTTFVVLRSISESLTETGGRLRVTASRQLSTPAKKNFAHADQVSVMSARLIAQKMSRYRPPNWDGAETETAVEAATLNFLEAIGITGDLDSYDPRTRWQRNAADSHFEVPIGFRSTENYEATKDLVTLDFGEASIQGTGLHGAIQGVTGSGKSYLLNGIVLSLCTMFGPDKVNLILMDFKGGATFADYENLPHVVANITNLVQEEELVERAGEVIEGEIIRRETYLREVKAKDVVAYRKMRAANPDKYPPLPDLFIIVDEFREFMETHKEKGYLKLLTRTGAVGRSLGMHIIPCSQYIDQSLLQDLMEHLTFGISLTTQTGQSSRAVLKDTEAAKDLPMGKGAAIVRRNTGERLTNFISFDVEAPYVTSRTAAAAAAPSADEPSALRLHRFNLANSFDDAPKSLPWNRNQKPAAQIRSRCVTRCCSGSQSSMRSKPSNCGSPRCAHRSPTPTSTSNQRRPRAWRSDSVTATHPACTAGCPTSSTPKEPRHTSASWAADTPVAPPQSKRSSAAPHGPTPHHSARSTSSTLPERSSARWKTCPTSAATHAKPTPTKSRASSEKRSGSSTSASANSEHEKPSPRWISTSRHARPNPSPMTRTVISFS